MILIPQLLQVLVEAAEAGATLPASLRYVAVGGAPVAEALLDRAVAVGLPVHQGYGLSETASVVSVNRLGSVGKPLPHARLRIADDGEILVGGSLFSDYLGQPRRDAETWWPTGDLGRLDEDGFLYLTGRRRHMFITACGRNVAPEWVEKELLLDPAITQVVVFGEARPFNVAVIVTRPGVPAEQVGKAVERTNRQLPDYARIGRYVLATEPFGFENGLLTGTGRPRRNRIEHHYRKSIDQLYEEVA